MDQPLIVVVVMLSVALIVLFAGLAGVVAVQFARACGATWLTAVSAGATAFTATVTLGLAVLGTLLSVLS